MNNYTRNLNSENGTSGGRDAAAHKRTGIAAAAAKVSLFFLLIFGAIAAQMHLRAGIERLNKRSTEIGAQIRQLNAQCTSMRNRKERLTDWPQIQAKIKHYRLGLQGADHRQISHITLISPRGPRKNLRFTRTASETESRSFAQVRR